jgi:hypothetical protein
MKNNTKKLLITANKGQRGISIYLAVITMSILLAIIIGLDAILVGQIKATRDMGYSVTAFYAAETGIEEALNDPYCTTTCLGYINKELDLGAGGKAYYTVSGYFPIWTNGCTTTATYCLKSVGIFNNIKRAVYISR